MTLTEAESALNKAGTEALLAYALRLQQADDPDALAKLNAYQHTLADWRDEAMARIEQAVVPHALH